jgi:hypothetical protein
MTLTLAVTALFAPAAVLTALGIMVWFRVAALRQETYPIEWALELSADRYRPMFRLLADDDFRFLRSQPGGKRSLINGLRRQRTRIFQGYLRCLERDFQVAFRALFFLMLHAPADRRDIARALIVSRFKFSASVFLVRCRLFLYRWNVGQQPIANLVHLFESLQLELLALSPAPESIATPQLS